MLSKKLSQFIKLESISGLLLLLMLCLALIFANTPLNHIYQIIITTPVHIGIGQFEANKPTLLWVNEGLMAIFFMLLAMEMKREILSGELTKPAQLSLPVIGALGGIILPIIIYLALNHGDSLKMRGWPIPTTTDIAFALGIIALLGKKVPTSLKVVLVALSIVDDVLAVIIIAAFYTDKLSWISITLSAIGLLALVLLNIAGVKRVAVYVIVGVFIWFFVLKSGVHATLAGVAIGLTIPYKSNSATENSPLLKLEKSLHPWVAFVILPVFVFLNGGVSFSDFTLQSFFKSVSLGISLGLLIGKTFGSFLLCWLAIKLKLARLPQDATYTELLGILALTGIGFTMSLFIASLAFNATILRAG